MEFSLDRCAGGRDVTVEADRMCDPGVRGYVGMLVRRNGLMRSCSGGEVLSTSASSAFSRDVRFGGSSCACSRCMGWSTQ